MRSCTAMPLLAMLAASGAQADDDIGRLFFTPQQRTQLEREHAHENPPCPALRLEGIVQKDNGPRTIWVNGEALNAGGSRKPDAQPLAAPGASTPVEIKVGQRLTQVPDTP